MRLGVGIGTAALAAHRRAASNVPSAEFSTLSVDPFAFLIAGTAAVDVALRNASNAPIPDIVPTLEAEVIELDVAACVLSLDVSTIEDDGISSATLTVRVIQIGGAPIVGLLAARVAVAMTGSGNTITAIDAATNDDGDIRFGVTSTGAGAKTLSATILSLAVTDTAALTVNAGTPTTFASSDFSGGTISPFTNAWGDRITVISDPTGSGRGNMAQITYAPTSGGSMERGLVYTHAPDLTYGDEMWLKFDFRQVAGSGNYNANHNRKIVDWQGFHVRLTLNRRDLVLRLSLVDAMDTGTETETFAGSTGITLNDDTWYTIEVRAVMNSADGVRDGLVEVYINGALTPNYVKNTGVGWITANGGQSYFRTLMTGYQLTIDGGDGTYTDTRYFDNVFYSSGRL